MASCRESGGASDSSASDEEVPTDRGSFPQPYAFEPTSARVNYHDDAESSGSESDDGFHGVDLEVADRTSGTYWCQCGNCVSMPSNAECTCSAEIANIHSRTDEIRSALTCAWLHLGKPVVYYFLLGLGGARRGSTARGVARNLFRTGDKTGGLGTEVTQRVQGQSPGGDLGAKPSDAKLC